MQFAVRALAIGVAMFLAGCATTDGQPGLIFAEAVEKMGITPVYPPREDLQVGDIYAVSAHTIDTRNDAKTALIARDDLTPQIRAYLASRYKLADTQIDGTGSNLSLKLVQSDARGKNGTVTSTSDLQTLPIDGFPQFDYDTGVSVGVEAQPQNLAAVFGFEAAKTLKMSLLFGGVTSYEVPIPDGLNALHDYCEKVKPHVCETQYLTNWLNQRYQLGPNDPGFVRAAGALMITKVFLARQITFTFNDATLAAAAAGSVSANGTVAQAPTISTAAINAAASSQDPANLQALADIQTQLNASLARQGSPGGAASFAGFSATGVTFKQIFARPVVIGYEGVSIQGR